MATLRVMSTSDPKLQGKSFEIGSEVRIGRDPANNDVVVSEGRVSRRHARIATTPEGMVIVDEGSDNGVWIGQQRVTRHVLANGDQFGIGETTFCFEDPLEVRKTVVMQGPPRAAVPPPTPAPAPPPVRQAPPPVQAAASVPTPPPVAAAPPSPPSISPTQLPAQPQPQLPTAPQKASGCAVGCLIASILLLLLTVSGSVIVLYRTGYLPGTHTEQRVP